MTDHYTPTTEHVRDGYSRKPPGHSVLTARERHGREFDRWLATVEAAAEQRGAERALQDFKKFVIRILPEDQIKRASILADLDESMNRLRETGHLLMGPLSADRITNKEARNA